MFNFKTVADIKKSSWIMLLVCIGIILIIPMLLQNDVISTIKSGSDMKAHLSFIKALDSGESTESLYVGQYVLGYILKPFANSGYLENIYLWVNFVILLCSAGVLYFVVRRLFNLYSALLVIPLAFFCTTGILSLFRYGIIFNIINMYIIFPLAVYYTAKWLDKWKVRDLIISLLLISIFTVFHSTGLYLLWGTGLALIIGIVYLIIKKKHQYLSRIIPFGMGVITLTVLLPAIFASTSGKTQLSVLSDIGTHVENLSYIGSMILSHLSLATMILAVLVMVLIFSKKIFRDMKAVNRIFLFLIGCFVITIIGGAILNTGDVLITNRLMVDATTLVAIGTACLLGIILENINSLILKCLTTVIIIGGSIPVLMMWLTMPK